MGCNEECGEVKTGEVFSKADFELESKCGEECGVAAVSIKKSSILAQEEQVSYILYNILSQLQHRGQTSSGIAVFSLNSRKRMKSAKAVGRVANLFKTDNINSFKNVLEENKGTKGIGHVRYATSNVSDNDSILEEEAQPFLRRHGRPWKRFAIAFNGHLTNYEDLRKELLEQHGYLLDTDVDTEVIMHLIALELRVMDERPNLFEVFKKVLSRLDGSFSFVFVNAEGDMVICRDKFGLRPLVVGENEDLIAISSESNAFSKIGIENFRSVEPGEILWIKDDKILSDFFAHEKHAHCHFEYVYFSDACSVNDGISVDAVRGRLGKELASEENLKERFGEGEWVVVPVPNTSIPAAMTYSQETGVPISLALSRADVGRGFINSSAQRNTVMNSKYNVIRPRVEGKKVILIDDSIVRGETSARIVKMLREKGKAKEVHLRVTEMPLKYPCCYGVDFHSINELIAGNFTGTKEELEKDVAEKIGADSVGYLSFDGLKKSCGNDGFCFACLNGEYPTEAGKSFLCKCMANLEKEKMKNLI